MSVTQSNPPIDARVIPTNVDHWQAAYAWGNHAGAGYAQESAFTAHEDDHANPHQVTASQVGLGTTDSPAFAGLTVGTGATAGIVYTATSGTARIYASDRLYLYGKDVHATSNLFVNGYARITSTVGINQTSPSAQLHVVPNTDKPAFIAQSITAQTANLQEWRDSAGSVLGSISQTGILKAAGYQSSDGSTGVNGSYTSADGKTVTVKNGLITSIA